MSKKFWKWSNAVESTDSELILDGVIASESWWGDEVTPQEFRSEIKKHSGNLTVILNSPGGDVFAGVSIYNALREYDGEVTVRVDGLAASIASIIAMAGDKVIMSPGSMMMIHKPWTFAVGNTDELDKVKEVLSGIEDSLIPIYATRTGLSKDEVTEMLNAETWMTGDQAVELGFADEAIEAKEKNSGFSDAFKNALNGQFAFSMKATEDSMQSFLAKVKAETEAEPEAEEVPDAPEAPEVPAETPDADPVEPPVETPEVDDVTEPSSEENNEPVEEEDMDPQNPTQDPAVEGLQAKAPKQPVKEPAQDMKAYLDSKESIQDFANILVAQAGKESKDVRNAWQEHLATKMGVTNPEILLPTPLITKIQDQFEKGGEIFSLVNRTGLTAFTAAWDEEDGDDSRARGYNRSVEDEKDEEVITIADRTLRPQFVYKYITLNKEDIKEQRDTGALVTYVLTELPRRIVREIERAIVIGDGRAGGHKNKISKILSVKADAASGDPIAVEYTPGVDESRYETLLRARDEIEAPGAVYVVAKKGYLTSLLLEQSVNGGYIFAPGTDVAAALGFAGKIEPDWFTDTNDPDNDAYLIVFSAYTMVGDNSIEAYTNFILKTNKNEYLQEIYIGGGLTTLKSAVAIAAVNS